MVLWGGNLGFYLSYDILIYAYARFFHTTSICNSIIFTGGDSEK